MHRVEGGKLILRADARSTGQKAGGGRRSRFLGGSFELAVEGNVGILIEA